MSIKSDEFFSKLNDLCAEYQVEINAADDGNGELPIPVIKITIQKPLVSVEVLSIDDDGVEFARHNFDGPYLWCTLCGNPAGDLVHFQTRRPEGDSTR